MNVCDPFSQKISEEAKTAETWAIGFSVDHQKVHDGAIDQACPGLSREEQLQLETHRSYEVEQGGDAIVEVVALSGDYGPDEDYDQFVQDAFSI